MIPVKLSHTTESSIVATGNMLTKASAQSGLEYLMLNRGVNSVEAIDLSEMIPLINFNANAIQVYPPSAGSAELRQAINSEYFGNKAATNQILITGGGISGLDMVFQSLNCQTVHLPRLFWGTYVQMLTMRQLTAKTYPTYQHLLNHARQYKDEAVVICDPGNPAGDKYNDQKLLALIEALNNAGAFVIVDCPYRRLFFDQTDAFYQELLRFENVIICESFSKSLGLSGQRIGFIHSQSELFNREAALRLMYTTNGINGFAQTLVTLLLTNPIGILAVTRFKTVTVEHIRQNITYLKQHNLLAHDWYSETEPLGIFAIVNKSADELFKHRIGAVGLDYFMLDYNETYSNFSRILVSVQHPKFASFFNQIK